MFVETMSSIEKLTDEINESHILEYEQLINIEEEMKKDEEKLLNTIYDTMVNYMNEHILNMSNEKFEGIFYDEMYHTLYYVVENMYDITEEKYECLTTPEELITRARNLLYRNYVPTRNYTDTFIRNCVKDNDLMDEKLEFIRSILQPEQRTKEWYEFRHNHLTASNIWKCFESESIKNSLIYSKCTPYIPPSGEQKEFVNTDSPLHWGHKYEPLSVLLYEIKYDTVIEEFGCIEHHDHKFIAASPDGINVKKSNERYGRMLEIKNIVNREITQIPKKEYWIQMQLQMEVTRLNECDFLETRFVEYNDVDAYDADLSTEDKGIILMFYEKHDPLYEYYVPQFHGEYEAWEEKIFKKHEGHIFMKSIYWKLDEFSCILVLRNKKWFASALPDMECLWNTVLKERVSGYEHRAPKRRVRKNSFNTTGPKCLIQITSDVKSAIGEDMDETVNTKDHHEDEETKESEIITMSETSNVDDVKIIKDVLPSP